MANRSLQTHAYLSRIAAKTHGGEAVKAKKAKDNRRCPICKHRVGAHRIEDGALRCIVETCSKVCVATR